MVSRAKADTLITAQSIIAGFLIAIAAAYNELNIRYVQAGGAALTPFLGALAVAALTVTAFRSILILFEYVHSEDEAKYAIAYDLFLVLVWGSISLTVIGAVSLLRVVVTQEYKPIQIQATSEVYILFGLLFIIYVAVVVIRPKVLSIVICEIRKLADPKTKK